VIQQKWILAIVPQCSQGKAQFPQIAKPLLSPVLACHVDLGEAQRTTLHRGRRATLDVAHRLEILTRCLPETYVVQQCRYEVDLVGGFAALMNCQSFAPRSWDYAATPHFHSCQLHGMARSSTLRAQFALNF
jgi:hypothetical protein